ncbi:hypothetical protein VTN00DRAFT_7782 [Thermoascus crustaceus]|uniref:uncharacterized protein n=1 Tax=Thermoascus crustaceus TaxID=5088 RepID=UPI003742C299
MGGQSVPAISNLCARCLQAQRQRALPLLSGCSSTPAIRHSRVRTFSTASPLQQQQDEATKQKNDEQRRTVQSFQQAPGEEKEEGAMSRKLAEMTEEAMLTGGRSARKNMQEAGFSEELKRQLEQRIADSSFKSDHAAAFSIVNMPSSAGRGTREHAEAAPWTGTERLEDTALRMLDDSKKPMRVPYKIPQPVDLKPAAKPKKTPGERLADARESTSTYTLSQSPGLSDQEREAVRKELRARFEPGTRSLPMTIQGLQSLANERIEDAMARGQFRNIPRGKGKHTETDHNANSAFIDTTEYLMNRIIQRQEIVPPWIEKQQELAAEVSRFRQRLRADWRQHAARLIASKGGSLEEQMRRARAYAAAEARLAADNKIRASLSQDSSSSGSSSTESLTPINHEGRLTSKGAAAETETSTTSTSSSTSQQSTSETLPNLPPLRDPDYLSIERGFHELSIKKLNDLTRSYNLQAPPVAQKPYLNLERELAACYADVAPTLADEIKRRATEKAWPSSASALPKGNSSGMFGGMLSSKQQVRVYEEDSSKGYGLKEFWRDLFGKKQEG